MKAAGAAILGAAVVGAGLLVAARSSAAQEEPVDDNEVDFDVDEALQIASNYYANALTDPIRYSAGQMKTLEGMLAELGMTKEASNIRDLRIGLFGDGNEPPEPLPDITFITSDAIDAIADRAEAEAEAAAQEGGE